jgi:hypothetical protein
VQTNGLTIRLLSTPGLSWATVFFILCFNSVAFNSLAQEDRAPARRGSRIIDDTTKQIYGPRTSKYFYENDVFFNKDLRFQIDTLIRNFHQWNYVQGNQNLYQDLGNIGTAIQPIFYQSPEVIGARAGAHVYDLYWNTEQIRYFDTKSPYSNMKVILGGKGRSITRATFSRNINERWNFGFTYRGLLIDKQILRTGKGDRITRSHYYDAYTAYQSKNGSYRLFANFQRMFHRVNEFGGVRIGSPDSTFAEFFEVNAAPWLGAATDTESNDQRANVHLFHQYEVGKGFQLYHIADRYRQRNVFSSVRDAQYEQFFDIINIDRDSAKDVSKFKAFRNEAGIKGNLSKVFYNGYVAIRHFKQVMNHGVPEQKGNETYLGGRIALQLDSLNELTGWMEINNTGNFRLQGEIRTKWFDARVKQLIYHPGFIPQRYEGAHDTWDQSFGDISVTQLNGYLHYRSSVIDLSPGLTFTRLGNYVFYDQVSTDPTVQRVIPIQSTGSQVIASPELRLGLTFFRHITFSNQVIYTNVLENADNAIRVPDLLINSQLSYANIFFNGNLDMHAGVDVHWKSEYYAPSYDPAIRQFYNQDIVKVAGFPLVDIFFSAKIKRGRVFLKYHNLVQAFTKEGYFITPFYPGQSNVFDFGFDWSFYD